MLFTRDDWRAISYTELISGIVTKSFAPQSSFIVQCSWKSDAAWSDRDHQFSRTWNAFRPNWAAFLLCIVNKKRKGEILSCYVRIDWISSQWRALNWRQFLDMAHTSHVMLGRQMPQRKSQFIIPVVLLAVKIRSGFRRGEHQADNEQRRKSSRIVRSGQIPSCSEMMTIRGTTRGRL